MRKKTMLVWAAIVTILVAAFGIWKKTVSVPVPSVQEQGENEEDNWSD